jgi:putative transposase
VRKTFKYRLYPTPAQETALSATLEECRWLYNHFLAERTATYQETGTSLSLYAQHAALPALKRERPSLAGVHSQVLQNVAVRVDLAFQAFFRRVRQGEKEPGYPRFRGKGRYDSFCYPQFGFKLLGGRVRLSGIGEVKAILHRPLEGGGKTCCVRRTSTGKWYATFSCEVAPDLLPMQEHAVGIDVGLATFATMSDGTQIANPRFFRRDEHDLKRTQRRLSREQKGTPARRTRRKVVAHVHERIANRRHDFAHQEVRKVVNRAGVIAVEDLSVNRMVHNHCLAKSISDAAWALFAALLSFKAAYAGRRYVAVNPAYTSQDCSRCGHRQKMPLSERMFHCPCCLLDISRDLNAALNILRLGLQSLGIEPLEAHVR